MKTPLLTQPQRDASRAGFDDGFYGRPSQSGWPTLEEIVAYDEGYEEGRNTARVLNQVGG